MTHAPQHPFILFLHSLNPVWCLERQHICPAVIEWKVGYTLDRSTIPSQGLYMQTHIHAFPQREGDVWCRRNVVLLDFVVLKAVSNPNLVAFLYALWVLLTLSYYFYSSSYYYYHLITSSLLALFFPSCLQYLLSLTLWIYVLKLPYCAIPYLTSPHFTSPYVNVCTCLTLPYFLCKCMCRLRYCFGEWRTGSTWGAKVW